MSPVDKRQTVMISENGKFTSTIPVDTDKLVKEVFAIADIEAITLVGPKSYTSHFEEKLKKQQTTEYSNKNQIKYTLMER